MSIKDKFDFVKIMALSQPAAVDMVLKRPGIPNLELLDVVHHVQAMPEFLMYEDEMDVGHRKLITMTFEPTGFLQSAESATLCIDVTDEPELVPSRTTEFFYDKPYMGSGGIGVALFGLPSIVLCSPFIAAYNGTVSCMEKQWGMSYRSHQAIERIKAAFKGVEEEYAAELISVEKAFKNFKRT